MMKRFIMRQRAPTRGSGVTLKQVAQRADCTVSVASTVLNSARGSTRVSTDLRERVERCAAELGYVGNYHAQALRVGRSYTVGLLFGTVEASLRHSRFFLSIMEGVDRQVRSQGSDLLLIGPSSSESDLERGLRYLQQGRIDALVIPGMIYAYWMPQVATLDSRIVVALPPDTANHPYVTVDLAPGIHEAIQHLAEQGHQRLLWIGPSAKDSDAAFRESLVRTTAAESGLEVCSLRQSLTLENGEGTEAQIAAAHASIADYLLQTYFYNDALPTAIIAYNEILGIGVCAALAEAGLRVPDDLSVIAFDDIVADVVYPPMTVVSLRLQEIGAAAARLALEMAESASAAQPLPAPLPARLIVRSSTAPPRRKP
jgi:LacI family transcriptional regulator